MFESPELSEVLDNEKNNSIYDIENILQIHTLEAEQSVQCLTSAKESRISKSLEAVLKKKTAVRK